MVGCEKVIDLEKQEVDRQLVINSVITNEEEVIAHVHQTIPYQEEDSIDVFKDIPGVSISLYKNQQFIDTFNYKKRQYAKIYYYSLDSLFPSVGNEYSITACKKGYEPVRATTFIPYPSKFSDMKCNIIGAPDDRYHEFKFTIHDPKKTNFYYINVRSRSIDQPYRYRNVQFTYSEDPAIERHDGDYNTDLFFFTDELFNGQDYEITFKARGYNLDSGKVVLELWTLSKDFYYYFQSLEDYNHTLLNSISFEPLKVYNNITGGTGIFAGYSIFRDTIKYSFHEKTNIVPINH